jgi:aminocarboxymuconate-semialdehyde decarboxylase
MDKSCGPAKLSKDPSVYLKTFYTDTVSPHAAGVKFAIDFFGIDNIMFGDDYPCWSTEKALQVLDEVGLSKADKEKVLDLNARRFFRLPEHVEPKSKVPALA